jgi:uncharacterized protein YgiM (DUF1202 family)
MKKFLVVGFLLWAQLVLAQDRGVFIDNESNVRSGPATTFPIVFQSVAGVEFSIRERRGKWLKVSLEDGKEGWTSQINVSIRSGKPAEKPSGKSSGTPAGISTEKGIKPSAGAPVEKVVTTEPPVLPDQVEAPKVDVAAAADDTPEISRWKIAIAGNGRDPVAHFMLGMAYRDAEMLGKAREQVRNLKNLSPVLAKDLENFLPAPPKSHKK